MESNYSQKYPIEIHIVSRKNENPSHFSKNTTHKAVKTEQKNKGSEYQIGIKK